MKQLLIISIVLLSVVIPVISQAQTTVEYTYGNSGNRKTRTVITLKSASLNSDSLKANDFNKPLDDKVGLQKTRIYPNPTQGIVRVDLPSLKEQEASIRVHDSQGRLILHQSASTSNRVDLSGFPSGWYIMIIRIGQVKKEWKIIKE
ncbi:MAG TPA: T9SS type A sorting domain-containing protein [Sunxiuqinia sp.]|nr:T9SS type A sorting domain-containing protein [Sunxiuqinia sp.]